MKQAILSVFLVFNCMCSEAQQKSIANKADDLKKYTYLILQYRHPDYSNTNYKTRVANASGFFVRYQGKLFLVSNYHVLTGVEGWNENSIHDVIYDSIKVRCYDNKGKQQFIKIDLARIERSHKDFFKEPDVYVFEIKPNDLPKHVIIYSIEKYLFRPSQDSPEKEVVAFNFGMTPGNDLIRQAVEIVRNSISHKATSYDLQQRQSSIIEKKNFQGLIADGQPITLDVLGGVATFSQALSAEGQSITLNGLGTGGTFNQVLAAGGRSITLNGLGAGEIYNQALTAEGRSITLNGLGAGATFNQALTADGQSITINGLGARGTLNQALTADGQSIILNGLGGVGTFSQALTADDQSITLNGLSGKGILSQALAADGQSITLNGLGGGGTFSQALTADDQSITLNGLSGRGILSQALAADGQSITLNGLGGGGTFSQGLAGHVQMNMLDSLGARTLDQILKNIKIIGVDENSRIRDNLSLPLDNEPHNLNDYYSSVIKGPQNNFIKDILGPSIVDDFYYEDDLFVMNSIDFETFLPSLYTGKLVSLRINDNVFGSLYIATTPSVYQGASGSPMFYKCSKTSGANTIEWIEFAGMQSSIDRKNNESLLIRPEQVVLKIRKALKK